MLPDKVGDEDGDAVPVALWDVLPVIVADGVAEGVPLGEGVLEGLLVIEPAGTERDHAHAPLQGDAV